VRGPVSWLRPSTDPSPSRGEERTEAKLMTLLRFFIYLVCALVFRVQPSDTKDAGAEHSSGAVLHVDDYRVDVQPVGDDAHAAHRRRGGLVMKPQICDIVTYRDSQGEEHNAFVTAVHGDGETPAINVAYVSSDEKKHDGYGRVVQRATSILHASMRSVTGICWRRVGEEMPEMPEPAPRAVRR
jgi:hypothetical protein